MQKKLKELLTAVEKELKKAEEVSVQAQKQASEVAAAAMHSPSQSGDRFHSQGAADIAKERVETLTKLKEEIKTGAPQFIKREGEKLFLVKNVALIPGFKLVSTDSPVGKGLITHVE